MCIPVKDESSEDALSCGRNSAQDGNASNSAPCASMFSELPAGLPCSDFTPYGDPEELGLTMVDGRWYYLNVGDDLLKYMYKLETEAV